jgi:hypothetical protein
MVTMSPARGSASATAAWASRSSGQLPPPGVGSEKFGELDDPEGHVRLAEGFAPVADHGGQEPGVLLGAADIGLALVPDGAGDGVRGDRSEHGVPEPAGLVAVGPAERSLGPGRCVTALALGAGGFALPLRERLFVAPFLLAHVVDDGRELFAQRRAGHPRLGGRAAVGGLDEPDGDAQLVAEPAAHEVADAAEGTDGVALAAHPSARHIVLCLVVRLLLDHHESEHGVALAGDDLVAAVGGSDGPLHVGLARAEPHLAHEDIAERDGFVGRRDGHLVRAARGERGHHEAPAAVLAGDGGLGHAGDLDADALARLGPSPDGQHGVALHTMWSPMTAGRRRSARAEDAASATMVVASAVAFIMRTVPPACAFVKPK